LELRSLLLVESRISSCSCRRPTWRGNVGDEDILPGTPSICYKIYQGEHCRSRHLCKEDASDTRLRSEASHKRVFPRCTATLRYRTARWRSRSSMSSNGCRTSRARIFHTASRNVQYFEVGLPSPYFCRCLNASTGNHTHLLFPDFSQPTPNHSGSRRAPVPQTRTPNTYRSIARRPRPWSLLSMGRPAGFVHLLPTLLIRATGQLLRLAKTSCLTKHFSSDMFSLLGLDLNSPCTLR